MATGRGQGSTGEDATGHPTHAWFEAPVCRNCGAPLPTPWCGLCGQKKAERLGLRDLARETWQRWRVFELDVARGALRLTLLPGLVAREFVLGARKRHVHPLKLLLVAIALLLVLFNLGGYLQSRHAEVNAVHAVVQRYANWSFARGIPALLATSLLLFPRRGFNPTEHLVLATYCMVLILAVTIVGLLPTLVWPDAGFRAAHRQVMGPALMAAKALIVAVAFAQFFRLRPRRDALRIALAAAMFVAVDWWLLELYSRGVTRLVMRQMI
ncbi:DUF3667 domain-containing protein [Luteimonas sp. Y-2-2-4F]|nr:DUF3667 domain-containing protein [Luteimonas sp. Y-2-2-4F]MCD9032398.1 DUF3667 domain-containing protein [Luteimonas sp. Y-2-2-4F]